MTLTNAGATQATFVALVVVAIAAVILVVPSFALLYSLQGRRMLGGGEQGTPPAARLAPPHGTAAAAHSGPPSPDRRPGSASPGHRARLGRDRRDRPQAEASLTCLPVADPGQYASDVKEVKMAYHKGTPETARKPTDRLGWPQVRSGPLVIGGILTGSAPWRE